MLYSKWLHNTRKHFLLEAIAEAHGNRLLAAERLGIHRNTLFRMLREDGIRPSDIRAIREAQPPTPATVKHSTPSHSIYRNHVGSHAQG